MQPIKLSKIEGREKKADDETSGHKVYFGSYYREGRRKIYSLYKENKYLGKAGITASIFEAQASALASLYGASRHSLPVTLVVDDTTNKVTGVTAINALNLLIDKKNLLQVPQPPDFKLYKGHSTSFLNFWKKSDDTELQKDSFLDTTPITQPEKSDKNRLTEEEEETEAPSVDYNKDVFGSKKGFAFLNQMPVDFFSQLRAAERQKHVSIDMDSLADVFTTSYALEEDDLHKGNIGFYITQENNKPCYHFFKIDHDLMLLQQIMGQRTEVRFANRHYKGNEFNITSDDLVTFPDTKTGAHYWPTRVAIIISSFKRAYWRPDEVLAYIGLKNDVNFIDAKWKRFLKQATMPPGMIHASLKAALDDPNSPESMETLAVMQRAAVTKTLELRARLIETPKFREFLKIDNNKKAAEELIATELTEYGRSIGMSAMEIQIQVGEALAMINEIDKANKFYDQAQKNKSSQIVSLHTSILTRSYRCYDVTKPSPDSLTKTNAFGQTALDLALIDFFNYHNALAKYQDKNDPNNSNCLLNMEYYAEVICDLLAQKASYNPVYEELLNLAKESTYLANLNLKLPELFTKHKNKLKIFETSLIEIDSRPWTKIEQNQKDAVALLEKINLSKSELQTLYIKLNDSAHIAPYTFLKQIQAQSMQEKQELGAYGDTPAFKKMNELISKRIQEHDAFELLRARVGILLAQPIYQLSDELKQDIKLFVQVANNKNENPAEKTLFLRESIIQLLDAKQPNEKNLLDAINSPPKINETEFAYVAFKEKINERLTADECPLDETERLLVKNIVEYFDALKPSLHKAEYLASKLALLLNHNATEKAFCQDIFETNNKNWGGVYKEFLAEIKKEGEERQLGSSSSAQSY